MTGVSALDFNFSFHSNDLYMKTNELSFFVDSCFLYEVQMYSNYDHIRSYEVGHREKIYSTIS